MPSGFHKAAITGRWIRVITGHLFEMEARGRSRFGFSATNGSDRTSTLNLYIRTFGPGHIGG